MRASLPRLAEFLGLRRNVVLLLAAIVLIAAGEELWMRFAPKYLEALGASLLVIGLFDAIKTLLGAVYAYPGGVAVDRWGHRRALVAFTALSLAGYIVVLAVPHWAAVIGGMFLFLAWTNLSLPATFSLVGAGLPAEKHAMGIGVQSLIRRLPVLIGPVAGGLLIDRYGVIGGVRAGLAVSIVLGGCAIFLPLAFREEKAPVPPRRLDLAKLWRISEAPLRRLLLSDILIRFCERIPFAWVVIHAMNNLGMSGTQVGVLLAVEMAAAIICYIPASHYADRYGKEPFVIATFVFFTLFPLTLLAAGSFAGLAFAFTVRGLKEFGEPARKALIIGYSPAHARGQMVGAYYLVRDLLVSSGSFLGVALWRVGPAGNFCGAAALGAAGTIIYVLTLRRRGMTNTAASA